MTFRNKRRAARALAALRGMPTYGRAAGYYNHSNRTERGCPEDGIADLLADVRHLCDALKFDFAQLDSRAYEYYVGELACSCDGNPKSGSVDDDIVRT